MGSLHCFIIVIKFIKCFYDDAFMELRGYDSNRIIFASCTKDCT